MPRRKLTTEDFIDRAFKIHDNKYDYHEVVYVNNRTKVKIYCKEHKSIFYQTPDHHLTGYLGCRACSKENRKQTNHKRYGVEYPMQLETIRAKQRDTCKKIFGVENSFQSNIIKEKIKQTIQKRYGVEYIVQTKEFKKTRTKKLNEKFGINHPLQSLEIKQQKIETTLRKYGVEHFTQQQMGEGSLKCLNDAEWLIEQHHINKKTLKEISIMLNVHRFTVSCYIKRHNIDIKRFIRSIGEKELAGFIRSLGYNILTNNRNIISPYELDIFIPSLNVALEYNGEYWHRNTQERDNIKHKMCQNLKILLIVVWDDAQWHAKNEETKSHIAKTLLKIQSNT